MRGLSYGECLRLSNMNAGSLLLIKGRLEIELLNVIAQINNRRLSVVSLAGQVILHLHLLYLGNPRVRRDW